MAGALIPLAAIILGSCSAGQDGPSEREAVDIASQLRPTGGYTQTLKVDALGPVTVQFEFLNTSTRQVAVPKVFPSCGCTSAEWAVSSIAPGTLARLGLTTIATQKVAKEYTARLLWGDSSRSEVRWTVVTPRAEGLRIVPTHVAAPALRHRRALPVTFLADYNQSFVPQPFEIVVTTPDAVLSSRLVSVQSQGEHALSGIVEIETLDIRALLDAHQDPVSLSVGAPGLAPETVVISQI